MATTILYIIIGFIIAEFLFERLLDYLNLQTWDAPLPPDAVGLYDETKYREARNYAHANFRFGLVSSCFSLLLMLAMLWFGGFAWVDAMVRNWSGHYILQSLLFFAVLGVGSMFFSLPFGIYNTFILEEKFGFNKTTPATFVADKIKGLVLGALLGGVVLALLVFLFHSLGDKFWLAAWVVVSVLTILIAMFYTSLLLPLFNKLTPLEDGSLRQRIQEYANKVSFPLTNIFVMDGSKRSAKANAFFSGLGSKKNIVLFDTLVNELTHEEITAVLAHEVGHYKRKHVLQSMLLSVAQMGLLFFLFGWLAGSPWMAEVLGAKENSFHLSFLVFVMLYSPVSVLLGLGMNLFSRKNEYEADAYARDTYAAEPLVTSLKKMSVNHLSNLQPHPAYVFVHYSHPTLLQRMRALAQI